MPLELLGQDEPGRVCVGETPRGSLRPGGGQTPRHPKSPERLPGPSGEGRWKLLRGALALKSRPSPERWLRASWDLPGRGGGESLTPSLAQVGERSRVAERGSCDLNDAYLRVAPGTSEPGH